MSPSRTENACLKASMAEQNPSALRRLLIEALYASGQVSAGYASVREDDAWQADMDRREQAYFDAKQALQTYLHAEHGIDRALAERMGDVL